MKQQAKTATAKSKRVRRLSLGELVRNKRGELGLSLRMVAGLAGMSNANISHLECGYIRDISLYRAARLAAVLGLTLDEMANSRQPDPKQ